MGKITFAFLFLFLSLFLIQGIFAAPGDTCEIRGRSACNAANTPFEHIALAMSSPTNANGELYDQGIYGTVLCCNFAAAATADHTCSVGDANKIIGLNSVTNSHAETPESTTYTTKVCYENIDCQSTAGSCAAGYNEILSLSGTTNAHIGEPGDYTQKICCNIDAPPIKDSSSGTGCGVYDSDNTGALCIANIFNYNDEDGDWISPTTKPSCSKERYIALGCAWDAVNDICYSDSETEYGGVGCTASNTQCGYTSSVTQDCSTSDIFLVGYTHVSNPSISDPECTDFQRSLSCPGSLKLPFFGWFNFISVFILVALVYFIHNRRKINVKIDNN